MTESKRIASIDILLGLTLILMILMNDLYLPGTLSWIGSGTIDFEKIRLANWVFPGFLFMIGMTIPYSIGKRIKEDKDTFSISKHILKKYVSLIIIGVLMLNSGRVNPEFTGLSKNLWAILMYAGVFLVWNNYVENEKNFFTISGLKLVGLTILIVLVFKFRSGEMVNNESLITNLWGIPGLVGWGYLVSAFVYLAIRDSLLNTVIVFLFFLSLSILSQQGLMNFLNPVKPVLGVILEGNIPMIVIAGLLTTLILKKYSERDYLKPITIISTTGIFCIIVGFILRKWFAVSEVQSTSGWVVICIGISMILFVVLYWIADIKKHINWIFWLNYAGENALTIYLVSYVTYNLIWLTGIPVFFYKQATISLVSVTGSVIWTLLVAGISVLLGRLNIRLKI
jgi:heparan-alpha-glucosaminide N-acetyltransferase